MIDPKDFYFINLLAFRFNLKQTKDTVWTARCPICGDSKKKKSKKRFFILAKGKSVMTYCHNCGWNANLRTFILEKAPDLLEEYNFYGFSKKKPEIDIEAFKKENQVQLPKKEQRSFISLAELNTLTVRFKDLKDGHPAAEYVKRRMIPEGLVRLCLNLHQFTTELALDCDFKHLAIPCMLIPFLRINDKIEIIQARFFDPKVKPKYLTLKLNPDAKKIYNADYVDRSKRVYILEGPIDSMFVPNSVAMAGSDMSGEEFKDRVWVYDNESMNKEILDKVEKRITMKEQVVIWKNEDKHKDINEMVMNEVHIDDVEKMLQERTYCGLKAKLEFSRFRRT